MNLIDIVILNINGADYRSIKEKSKKRDGITLMQNINLNEKNGTLFD